MSQRRVDRMRRLSGVVLMMLSGRGEGLLRPLCWRWKVIRHRAIATSVLAMESDSPWATPYGCRKVEVVQAE